MNDKYLFNEDKENKIQKEMNEMQQKLLRKKAKIKKYKANIEVLICENEELKKRISELESQNKQYNESNINKENELLSKINVLESNLYIKNDQLEKIQQMEMLRSRNIEMLNQKCKEYQMIIEQNKNEYNQQLNILSNENNHYKNKIEELDKMFLLFNFFIKRISTIFPSMTNHIISFEDSKKFQNELIYFENCIIDLNQQNISLVNKIKQYQNTSHSMPIKISEVSSMEEKIKQIAEENKRLELKLKSKQNIK